MKSLSDKEKSVLSSQVKEGNEYYLLEDQKSFVAM